MSTAAATTTTDGRACDNNNLAVVSLASDTPSLSSADRAALISPSPRSGKHDPSVTTSAMVVPNDRDVLCGRGKGIRRHPGNELYNRLLRERYDEYKAAPKGSKVSIVKKIVLFVREGQLGGRGRFLERKKQKASDKTNTNNSNSNKNNNWLYIDIGNERAMNKTAQAFRDIRVTMERHHIHRNFHNNSNSNSNSNNPTKTTTSEEDGASDDSASSSIEKVDQGNEHQEQSSRRPTFRERLAMLKRQQERQDRDESNSDDDEEENNSSENENESDNEDKHGNENDVSDTETEESFPMYSANKAPTKH